MRYFIIVVLWIAAMLLLAALGQWLDLRRWRRTERYEREQLRRAAQRSAEQASGTVLPWRRRADH